MCAVDTFNAGRGVGVTDFTCCTLGVFAASIAAYFLGIVTDKWFRAVCVLGAGDTFVLATDLSAGAVFVFETLIAGGVCCIAEFAVGAVAVRFATFAAAFAAWITDERSVITVGIVGAICTLIVFTDFSILTIAVVTTTTDTELVFADSSFGALFGFLAAYALTLFTELSGGAVRAVETTFTNFLVGITFLVVGAV